MNAPVVLITGGLTGIGRAWAGAGMGRVVGITPSQASRNTLAAGVPESYNTAQFLGHLPGRRGARGPKETGRPAVKVHNWYVRPAGNAGRELDTR